MSGSPVSGVNRKPFRRDVARRAEEFNDLGRVAAREFFPVATAHFHVIQEAKGALRRE
jgi:hypothetical protein